MYKIIRYFYCSVYFLIIILSSFFVLDKLLLVFLIATNILLSFIFRKNIPLLIFSIFITFYSIALIPYFFLNYSISFFDFFNRIDYYRKALKVQSVLLASLFLFVSPSTFKNNYLLYLYLRTKTNNLYFYFFYILCIIVLLFGLQGETIFQSGAYYSDAAAKASFYEYFILFFLISFYYSSRKKFHLTLLFILYSIYVIKTLLYGGRIEVVEMSIMTFLLFSVNYSILVSPKKVLIFLLLFYYSNIVVSNFRNNIDLVINNEYLELLNPVDFLNSGNKVIYSNEGEVFHSSVRLVSLADQGYIPTSERIKSSFLFVLSVFVPIKLLPPYASLISYKQYEANSGGG